MKFRSFAFSRDHWAGRCAKANPGKCKARQYFEEKTITQRSYRAAAWAPFLLLCACSDGGTERESRTVNVVADKVSFLPDQQLLEAVGTARAAKSAELYSEAAGQVVAVRFTPGSFVAKGQVLIELDARQEQLALKLADIRVREAQQLLARYRRIENTGALSESQIEAGETALAAAQVERDQAATRLADMTVRAPFAGYISFTDVDVGDRITPETRLAQLDQRATLFVEFDAPEALFSRLRPGGTVRMAAFSDPDREMSARIVAIDSNIGLERRSYRVRALVDNRDDRFRPGMSFRIRFEDDGVLRPASPEAAVVWGGDGASVFVVRGGKAVQVPVTIASRREGLVLLDAEIPADTLIVVEGVHKIRDGQRVELVEPGQAPAANIEVAQE